jgi:hypothetical protein
VELAFSGAATLDMIAALMNGHICRLLLTCVLFSCVAALAVAQSYPPSPGAMVPAPPAPSAPPGQSVWPPPALPSSAPPEQSVWPPPAPSQSPPPGQYLIQPAAPVAPSAPPADGELTIFSSGITVPLWDVSVDALWLERSTSRGVRLGTTDWYPGSHAPPAIPTDWLGSDDVLFPLEPGIRLQLIGQVSDGMAIDVTGWGLQQWSVGRAVYGDPEGLTVLAYSPWLQTSPLINGFDDNLAYTYKSQVANVELNQRFRFCTYDPFNTAAWLWGVRYFYLSDDFSLSGSDLTTGTYENLDWQTKNNLIGLQLGMQWTRGWDRFQLNTEVKVGLFANVYSQEGADSVSGPSGAQPYNLSHSGTDLAALFEASIAARYRVTSCLWLRAGYQFYYAAGLATGPRQLGGFDHNGDVGLDGLSLGMEYMR